MMMTTATKPTVTQGIPYADIPGLPPIYQFVACGDNRAYSYAFHQDGSFTDNPSIITLNEDGEFVIRGIYDKGYNHEIFRTGARRCPANNLRFYVPIANWRKLAAHAAKWCCWFDQQSFDAMQRQAERLAA